MDQEPYNSHSSWTSQEGSPFPLGLFWVAHESAYNFAVYSKHARCVELVFFSNDDLLTPIHRFDFDYLTNKSGPIWHCRIAEEQLSGAHYYAYRVGGPDPRPGFRRHNFNPEKLLLDPYATEIYFPGDFDREAAVRPGSNAGKAPLAVLRDVRCAHCENEFPPQPALRHDGDLVIYELHVRGFTRHPSSGLPEAQRGTFAGVVQKIPCLQDLGITAVELMPVFQFDPSAGDYWGYMPMSFFAPHHPYSAERDLCHPHREFQEMVNALHAAGIEVILDVVYNHTTEGDERGPVYSLKGIDNTTYYMLTNDPARPYANFSGTGNTIHTRNRAVRQLIIDSLRHWAATTGVDGFRFDLASVFARNPDGSVSPEEPPIFGELASHPELATLHLIAEPWDASGLFQLGQRFPGTMWRQWNAAYRDTLQRFVRGDPGLVGDLMTRLYGSTDCFPDTIEHAFHPYQSVNYISSHDGFTLYDLTAYDHKNNWANGHRNTDGPNEPSWNCGWEGDGEVPDHVLALRKQQVKNFFCLLMLSNGTPMFRMGDEFLNTQHGNNNPYNQDNESSWLDWKQLETNRDMFRFFREMIAFRKAHPAIARSRFWRDDVHWFGAAGAPDLSPDSRQLAYCLHGGSGDACSLYVMINATPEATVFQIQHQPPAGWRLAIDTSAPSPEDIASPAAGPPRNARSMKVPGRAVVVLENTAPSTKR